MTKVIEDILNTEMKNSNRSFSVLSNPEFLSEGSAIEDLENPQRVLIGGEDHMALELVSSIYRNWIDKKKIIIEKKDRTIATITSSRGDAFGTPKFQITTPINQII